MLGILSGLIFSLSDNAMMLASWAVCRGEEDIRISCAMRFDFRQILCRWARRTRSRSGAGDVWRQAQQADKFGSVGVAQPAPQIKCCTGFMYRRRYAREDVGLSERKRHAKPIRIVIWLGEMLDSRKSEKIERLVRYQLRRSWRGFCYLTA